MSHHSNDGGVSLTFHILCLSLLFSVEQQSRAHHPHFKSAPVTSILLFRKHHHHPPTPALPLIPAGTRMDHKALKTGGWETKIFVVREERREESREEREIAI